MKTPTQGLQKVSRFIFSFNLGQAYNCFSSSKHVKYLQQFKTCKIFRENYDILHL